jgi:hypothetical protein
MYRVERLFLGVPNILDYILHLLLSRGARGVRQFRNNVGGWARGLSLEGGRLGELIDPMF